MDLTRILNKLNQINIISRYYICMNKMSQTTRMYDSQSAIVKQIINNLDLLNLPRLSIDPTIEKSGYIYYNTSSNVIRVSTGHNTWVTLSAGTLPPPLVSIAGLSTSGDEMLYTTGTDVYATSTITSQGRDLVAAANQNAGQSVLGTVVGTDV